MPDGRRLAYSGPRCSSVESSGYTVGNSTMLELLWKFLGYSVKYRVKFTYMWVLINHSYNVCSLLV